MIALEKEIFVLRVCTKVTRDRNRVKVRNLRVYVYETHLYQSLVSLQFFPLLLPHPNQL